MIVCGQIDEVPEDLFDRPDTAIRLVCHDDVVQRLADGDPVIDGSVRFLRDLFHD